MGSLVTALLAVWFVHTLREHYRMLSAPPPMPRPAPLPLVTPPELHAFGLRPLPPAYPGGPARKRPMRNEDGVLMLAPVFAFIVAVPGHGSTMVSAETPMHAYEITARLYPEVDGLKADVGPVLTGCCITRPGVFLN